MQNDIVKTPSDTKTPQPATPKSEAAVQAQPASSAKPVLDVVPPQKKPTETTDAPKKDTQPQEKVSKSPTTPKGKPGPGLAIFWAVVLSVSLIGLTIYMKMTNA